MLATRLSFLARRSTIHSIPVLLRPALHPVSSVLVQSRSYAPKKKASKNSKSTSVSDDDLPPSHSKTGKSKGKGTSAFLVEDEGDRRDASQAAGPAFDLGAHEMEMDKVVDRLRVSLKTVVGRVGKVSAGTWSDSLRFRSR